MDAGTALWALSRFEASGEMKQEAVTLSGGGTADADHCEDTDGQSQAAPALKPSRRLAPLNGWRDLAARSAS